MYLPAKQDARFIAAVTVIRSHQVLPPDRLAAPSVAFFERPSTRLSMWLASKRVLPVCTRRSGRVKIKKRERKGKEKRTKEWGETSFIPMHKRALVQALTLPTIFSPFSFPRAPRAPQSAIVIGFSFRDRAKTARWKYITGSQLQPVWRPGYRPVCNWRAHTVAPGTDSSPWSQERTRVVISFGDTLFQNT